MENAWYCNILTLKIYLGKRAQQSPSELVFSLVKQLCTEGTRKGSSCMSTDHKSGSFFYLRLQLGSRNPNKNSGVKKPEFEFRLNVAQSGASVMSFIKAGCCCCC